MATGIRDLHDMNHNIFDDDRSAVGAVDPNLLINLRFQSVTPFDPTSSDYESVFNSDQHTLYHHNTIDAVELRKDQHLIFEPNSFVDLSGMSSGSAVSNSASNGNSDSPEDCEGFSDILLSYINQLLMEEDLDDKFDVYPEHPALLAAEKTFCDILEEKLPLLPDKPPSCSSPSLESPEDSSGNGLSCSDGSNSINWPYDEVGYHELPIDQSVLNFSSQFFNSTTSFSYAVECQDSLKVSDYHVQALPMCQMQRGLNEGQKLIPRNKKSNVDIYEDGQSTTQNMVEDKKLVVARNYSDICFKGRKNLNNEELDILEGRSNKQSTISFDDPSYNDMLDDVLLSNGLTDSDEYRMKLQVGAIKSSHASNVKGPGSRRRRSKRKPKEEVVDLRTMLIHCAQSVSNGGGQSANDLLKRIKQHSSPYGDANQRLAHYFSQGLEARLAGTGSQVYSSYSKKLSVTDVLKSYQLYTTACPFMKVSHFFSDQTILNVAKDTMRLHIIEFGIYYGLQWPCFMQQLSKRPGGPPKLRITGVDLPLPGFRPTELVDETGRRLSEYARKFNIPFEFHAISIKWETLQVEDLNIDNDEVLVVNCIYRFSTLMDESMVADSPRNIVLNLIRKLNPAVFIHGIINGCYGLPFFLSRFREALFNFSALFDMIEANASREDESRLLIEKILFGRNAVNVIACEGPDRNERPETYKQWQIRTLNAGFTQIPLDRNIMKKANDKLKACYHKDFVVDEDSQWLQLGWKGRILHALSAWKPNNSS